jgi:hypothetical protein
MGKLSLQLSAKAGSALCLHVRLRQIRFLSPLKYSALAEICIILYHLAYSHVNILYQSVSPL